MDEPKSITTPLDESLVRSLRAAQRVLLTGTIYTARDMAHKRLCDALNAGEPLPFELDGAVIYFLGPTPARPGTIIGSAGPTTSSRMDPFTPKLIARGLKATIGKGYRSDAVRAALQQYGAVHFGTIGGIGALLSTYITSCKAIAYDDLGPEAIRELTVKNMPLIVVYDAHGGSVYKQEPDN